MLCLHKGLDLAPRVRRRVLDSMDLTKLQGPPWGATLDGRSRYENIKLEGDNADVGGSWRFWLFASIIFHNILVCLGRARSHWEAAPLLVLFARGDPESLLAAAWRKAVLQGLGVRSSVLSSLSSKSLQEEVLSLRTNVDQPSKVELEAVSQDRLRSVRLAAVHGSWIDFRLRQDLSWQKTMGR